MNKERRKEIKNIFEKLQQIKIAVENIISEEQEYHDNIPENLQSSERAEISENAIYELDCVLSNIDDALCCLDCINEC